MLSEKSFSDRGYLVCAEMNKLGIKNCFTMKTGGVSSGNIEGLNLGFRVNDDKESVLKNYRLVANDLELDFDSIVTSKQTHSNNIRIIENEDRGKGVTKVSDIEDTDGLITGEKNLPLVVFSADCYPVLLADKEKKAVGAVHSGWRGTLSGISGKAAKVMVEELGVNPENIIAAIGPGIGRCCFETEIDVASKFEKCYVSEKGKEKFLIDLPEVIKNSLIKNGVKEENIFFADRCTVCESDKFYSYRVQKEKTGRMGAFISL